MKASFHEKLTRSEEVKGSSNRSFGMVFAVVFAIIGFWPLISSGSVRLWVLALALVFLSLALFAPKTLTPLNRLWLKFGLLLHKVVNPVVMAVMFFVVITPTALVVRFLGKRLLDKSFDPDAESYWIHREPPGPEPADMKNQF